jgi:hypothetical protein
VTEPLPAKRAIAALLAATALALAACGGDDGGEDKLDTGDIERRLRETLAEKPAGRATTTQLEISSFECPDEVEKKKGTEFECDIEAQEGLSGTVEVELDDDAGEAVTYEAQLEGENRSVGKSGSLRAR